MVVKRQCSFCAGEIEPGTGSMFVKRDGTVYHFCSASCRKQQLHLGRVGHRFKWTRAHALKRAADMRSSAAAGSAGAKKSPSPKSRKSTPPGEPEATATSAADAEPKAAEPASANKKAEPAPKAGAEKVESAATPAKKPRAKSTKPAANAPSEAKSN